jgi:hypothetical protein
MSKSQETIVPANPGFYAIIEINGTPAEWPPMSHIETTPIIAWIIRQDEVQPVISLLDDASRPPRPSILRPDGRVDGADGQLYETLHDYARKVADLVKQKG